MRFVNLFGVLLALAFALCLFACDDTVSSTDSSETNGLDAIPGFNVNRHSPESAGTSSSSEVSSSSVGEYSLDSEEGDSSSSEEGNSSSSVESLSSEDSSSSSSEESSSSEDSSSSSSEELSSSSISVQNPGTDIGTCGPEKDVVERDELATWKFTMNPEVEATQLLRASFSWTFDGGTPATVQVKGASGNIQEVQYATSGDHSASLVVSMGASTYNLTCSPVHVNGDPITGCKCVAQSKKPDITVGGSWTVTGCTSEGANIVGYEWEGAYADAWGVSANGFGTTATYAFVQKHERAAPIVKVSNDDNTVVSVQCDTVVSVDASYPDIESTGPSGAVRLPAGSTMVTLMVNAISNTVFCQGDSASGPPSGSVNDVDFEGNYYITASMPAETLVSGTELDFHLTEPATCGVQ